MAVKRKRRSKASAKKRNIPTNKKLYARVKAKVKRKFKVYPSAYANASLVKQYKAAGGKYRRG
jgi:flagellar capping protein FliD